MNYSVEHINSIVNGSLLRLVRNSEIQNLLTDSRRLVFPSSTLFFALPGARRDGHQFIPELYHRGVRNFVISRELAEQDFPEANFILVSNTLLALQLLARYHRKLFDIPVIGITGSNGKTIVKEWLNQMLEDRYNIVRSPRSYNSQIGVPLSVWQMNSMHEMAIFEAGISQSGEMENLEPIIRPGIGIFTNIGEAHSEGFANIQKKIAEKLRLFRNASVIVYRLGNPEWEKGLSSFMEGRQDLKSRLILFSWGKTEKATLRIESEEKQDSQTILTLLYYSSLFNLIIPFTDDASVENAMHCISLLLYLKMSVEDIQKRLLRLSAVAMRLEIKTGINHCSLINDSYSADLNSLRIALGFLDQQHQHAKHTVIVSDILQSGKPEAELYFEMAGLLSQHPVTRLIAIGERISANKEKFDCMLQTERLFYPNTEDFIKSFDRSLFRDEVILIKGARVFQFEHIEKLLSQQVHETLLEIDLNAMAHNLRQYQNLLQPSTRIMAMVKASAYGTGSFEVANLLQFHKADYLAVAYADEGTGLRNSGIHLPIMVMNSEEGGFETMIQHQLEPVIFSMGMLQSFSRFLRKQGIVEFPVHLEIETGMNRLGFPTVEIPGLIKEIRNGPLRIVSVFSHLAASEEMQQDDFTRKQFEKLLDAANQIQSALPYAIIKHIANSAAIIRYPEMQLDMVRLGIGLYGVDSAASGNIDLKEVATLKTTIAQIKHLNANETVGYNRKGIASEPARIATVRIGYADGYSRSLGNGLGKMMVRGAMAPTMGSICMDMTMIDISHIPAAREGDEVTVFGPELSVEQLARWAGSIPYEILTGISQRVKRVYFED